MSPTIREETEAKKKPKITTISAPMGLTGKVGIIQIRIAITTMVPSRSGIGRSRSVRRELLECFLDMLAIACLKVRIISGKVLIRLIIPPAATAPAPMYLI